MIFSQAIDKNGNRNAFWTAIYDADTPQAIVAATIGEVRKLATPRGKDVATQQGLRKALYPDTVKEERKRDKAADKKDALKAKADAGDTRAQKAVNAAETKSKAERIAENIEKVKAFMGNREKVPADQATDILIAILTSRPDVDLAAISHKVEGIIEANAEAAGLAVSDAA